MTRLAPQAAELLKEVTKKGLPVWIRPPKAGGDRWTGLSRAKLYELISSGKIRSVAIREPGKLRGSRLINLASVLEFIVSCERADARLQAKEATKRGTPANREEA